MSMEENIYSHVSGLPHRRQPRNKDEHRALKSGPSRKPTRFFPTSGAVAFTKDCKNVS